MADWKWGITIAIAVYGAGLSTFREVQSRRLSRPQIKVRLNLNIVGVGDDAILGKRFVQVWVENHGRDDVLFDGHSVSLIVRGSRGKKEQAFLIFAPRSSVNFPHTLKSGGSFYVMQEKNPLIDTLRTLSSGTREVDMAATVHDAISRSFRSKWQRVNLFEE